MLYREYVIANVQSRSNAYGVLMTVTLESAQSLCKHSFNLYFRKVPDPPADEINNEYERIVPNMLAGQLYQCEFAYVDHRQQLSLYLVSMRQLVPVRADNMRQVIPLDEYRNPGRGYWAATRSGGKLIRIFSSADVAVPVVKTFPDHEMAHGDGAEEGAFVFVPSKAGFLQRIALLWPNLFPKPEEKEKKLPTA